MSGKKNHRLRQTETAPEKPSGSKGNHRRLIAAAIIVVALAAAAAISVVAFASRSKVERVSTSATASRQATGRFRTVLANGMSFSSRDLTGKPTVAGFVIENCTSCVSTLQTLAALSKDGVRTIAVNVNVPPGTNPVKAASSLASFAGNVNAGGETLYAADPGQHTAQAFGVRQIESYLIFDAHGREIGHGIGLTASQIRSALKQQL
jgi:cytochrome oxidase Cu insertion factor (SCO1/SenC/PrrC family)